MSHCFVTAGRMLENWVEAFPGAQCVLHLSQVEEGVVWYRLPVIGSEYLGRHLEEVRRARSGPLVVLSDEPREEEALLALSSGVSGYCNSRAAPEVLRQVALVVENGGLWVGQSVVQRLVRGAASALQQSGSAGTADWANSLSEREREVAELVAKGESNKEIARELSIAERTVKAHLGAIFDKLGVRDRLQLSLKVNGINR